MSTTTPLAEHILGYLTGHPEAQDTIEGITEWWLLEQRIRLQISEVKQALAELVARGLVVESQGRDGRIRYAAKGRKKRWPE